MPFGSRGKAPSGPAQGGKENPPRSLFRNDWKRGPQYAGSGPRHENVVQSHAEDHRLENLLQAMESSKTSKHRSLSGFFGKKNSKEYTAVMQGLRSVLTHTKVPFKFDSRTNAERAKNVSDAYFRLISACEAYIAKPGGEEGEGLARKNMVRSVLDLAKQDITAVQQCYFDIYSRKISESEQEKLTWDKVIAGAREATIEVDDLHNDDVFKPLGGKMKTGDKASRLMQGGVFTKEEIADISKSPSFGASFKDFKNQEGDYGGDTTNVTNRNVATSRVAGLLGLSGIVEDSKTVNVKDKKSGQTFRGNMMSIAKGREANKEEADLANKTKGMKSLEERKNFLISSIAPSAQKELCSLQILDFICGQNDRHTGNYFMEKDKQGRIAHVHGIDNDQSFSTGVDFAKVMGGGGFSQDKLRPVVDAEGNLSILYMDKQLADNIVALQPEVVEFALQDLLGPKYIQNTIERLKLVQTAIKNEPADSPRFKKDNEWNEQTARDMIEKDYTNKRTQIMKSTGKSYKNTEFTGWDTYKDSTYFGQFAAYAMGFDGDGGYEGL